MVGKQARARANASYGHQRAEFYYVMEQQQHYIAHEEAQDTPAAAAATLGEYLVLAVVSPFVKIYKNCRP